jgi:hypothetical protein
MTVNQLVTLVRQRSDQINSSTFDDESELKPWVRGSLAQLYALLCRRSVDYYTTCRPISLMAKQEAYSLPSDFQSLQDVFLLYGGGASRLQLRPFGVDEFGALNTPQATINPIYKYRLQRNLLFLQPVPTVDSYNALEIYYTPQYRPPLLDYSTLDDVLPNGFEEWVVLDVLGKMSIKTRLQNMDDIRKTQSVIQSQIMATAQIRDSFAPVMRDGMRQRRTLPTYAAAGGPLYWCIP